MDITGSQKVNAPRQQVYDALFNPTILKNSIPGCESSEYVELPTGRELKLELSLNFLMLKGTFTTFIKATNEVAPSHVVLITEPYNALGSIKASCTVDLVEDTEGTSLNYATHATLEGKLAATPEIMVKGAVKSGLEQFFKNFEKQVSTINT